MKRSNSRTSRISIGVENKDNLDCSNLVIKHNQDKKYTYVNDNCDNENISKLIYIVIDIAHR